MLIWGFRTLFKTLGQGTFHCSRCGGDRPYKLCLARRWFTLFFIPIFTYKEVGRLVQCEGCGGQYDEAVLARPTSAQLSTMLVGGTRWLVVEVLRAQGTPTTAAREAAVSAVLRAGSPGYDLATLDNDLTSSESPASSRILGPLGPQIHEQGREMILGAAAGVAVAGGGIGPAERAVLEQAGGHLLMTPAHIAGVIATAQRQAPHA